jgi:hypothetical protein
MYLLSNNFSIQQFEKLFEVDNVIAVISILMGGWVVYCDVCCRRTVHSNNIKLVSDVRISSASSTKH